MPNLEEYFVQLGVSEAYKSRAKEVLAQIKGVFGVDFVDDDVFVCTQYEKPEDVAPTHGNMLIIKPRFVVEAKDILSRSYFDILRVEHDLYYLDVITRDFVPGNLNDKSVLRVQGLVRNSSMHLNMNATGASNCLRLNRLLKEALVPKFTA